MMSNCRFSEAKILALLSYSDKHELTPAQEAACKQYIDERTAIVRRSHQLHPGDAPEDIQSRDAFVQEHMDCTISDKNAPLDREEIARICKLRQQGLIPSVIAKRMERHVHTVRKVLNRYAHV